MDLSKVKGDNNYKTYNIIKIYIYSYKRSLRKSRFEYNIIYSNIINFRAYSFGFIIIYINNKFKYSYYYFIFNKIGIFSAFRSYRSVKEYSDYYIYYFYTDKDSIYVNKTFADYRYKYSIV
jgi:hypothetical protein